MKRFATIAILSAAVFGGGGMIDFGFAPNVARADEPASKPALPEAKQIIEKFIAATGGREAYKKFTSRTTKGSFDIPAQGMKGTMTVVQEAPNKGLVEMDFPSFGLIRRGSDGETVWASDPMTGTRIVDGAERDALVRQFRFDTEAEWEKYYRSVETIGEDVVNDRPTYKVKLITATDEPTETVSYYDKESGLLVRMDSKEQAQGVNLSVVSFLSDYKDFDGVKIPTVTTQEAGGARMSIKVISVEHNKPIDPALLALPDDVKKLKQKTLPATQPAGK